MQYTGVLGTSAFAGVQATQVSVDISVYFWEHSLRKLCTCSRACAICSLAFGNEVGGVLLVYDAEHLLLAWGVIVDMRKIGVLTVFSLFSMGVGVYVGIRVCICTCTNTVSDVRPGVGTRRFKSWKNPDGLSLRIHISICVYKVYTYMSLATALWPVDQSHCFLLLLLRIIFNKHPNIKKKLNQYRIKSESNVLRICFFIEI